MEGDKKELKSIQICLLLSRVQCQLPGAQELLHKGRIICGKAGMCPWEREDCIETRSASLTTSPPESWASWRRGKRDLGLRVLEGSAPEGPRGQRYPQLPTHSFIASPSEKSCFALGLKEPGMTCGKGLNYLNIGQELIYGALHGLLIQLCKIFSRVLQLSRKVIMWWRKTKCRECRTA